MADSAQGPSDDVLSYMRDMEGRLHERLDRVDGDVAQTNADLTQVKADVAEIKSDVTQVKRVIGEARIEAQIAVDAVADLYGRLEGT